MKKDRYIRREKIEWCSMRWNNAPDTRKPRALLIGDSIANGYHRFAVEQLNRRFNVDLLATSKSLDDQG